MRIVVLAGGLSMERNVFSATHRSRQKTDHIAFASADAKLCEAFQQAEKGGLPPPFSVSLE